MSNSSMNYTFHVSPSKVTGVLNPGTLGLHLPFQQPQKFYLQKHKRSF